MLGLDEVDLEQKCTNSSFVLFRFPQSTEFYIGYQKDAPKTFLNLTAIKETRGFLIAPFFPTAETPYILLDKINISTYSLPKEHSETLKKGEVTCNGKSLYQQAFRDIHQKLAEHAYKKIVLARKEEIKLQEYSILNIYNLFLKACQSYYHSYIALWYTPLTGFWITATPELLLSQENIHCQTMALAGTMSADNKKFLQTDNWSEKNRKEHLYVTEFIEEQLSPYAIDLQKTDTYPIQYGKIIHLRTDFKFQMKLPYSSLDLIGQLHPTPAICGTPTDRIQKILLQHEQINRKYYAGFSGLIDNESTKFYVTLRCMNIVNNQATLYAGGGVLAESKERDEWEETERKLNTMRELFEK